MRPAFLLVISLGLFAVVHAGNSTADIVLATTESPPFTCQWGASCSLVFEKHPNVIIPATDNLIGTFDSAAECSKSCEKNKTCVVFTYFSNASPAGQRKKCYSHYFDGWNPDRESRTIRAQQGAETWAKSLLKYNNLNFVAGLAKPGDSNHEARLLGKFNTASECAKACQRHQFCHFFTHFSSSVAKWANMCYYVDSYPNSPVNQTGVTSFEKLATSATALTCLEYPEDVPVWAGFSALPPVPTPFSVTAKSDTGVLSIECHFNGTSVSLGSALGDRMTVGIGLPEGRYIIGCSAVALDGFQDTCGFLMNYVPLPKPHVVECPAEPILLSSAGTHIGELLVQGEVATAKCTSTGGAKINVTAGDEFGMYEVDFAKKVKDGPYKIKCKFTNAKGKSDNCTLRVMLDTQTPTIACPTQVVKVNSINASIDLVVNGTLSPKYLTLSCWDNLTVKPSTVKGQSRTFKVKPQGAWSTSPQQVHCLAKGYGDRVWGTNCDFEVQKI